MKVSVKNVTISAEKLSSVIDSLEDAIERNSRLKELCEEILRVQAGESTGGAVISSAARRPRRGKTLRQTIVEILEKTKKPIGAGVLRDKVLKEGYQTTATPHSFYTAVYNTANQDSDIVRTEGGFILKKNAGSAAKGGRKKAKKKGAR